MLHGIEMNVIEVTQEVVLAAQRVLPISPLPNPALAFDAAAVGDWLAARQSMRKAAFDQAPAQREIRIAIRVVTRVVTPAAVRTAARPRA